MKVDEERIINFFDTIERSESSNIYASVISRFFNLSRKETLDVMDILVETKIAKRIYKIKISDKFFPEVYQSLQDIPKSIMDEESYVEVPTEFAKHVFVCLKVI